MTNKQAAIKIIRRLRKEGFKSLLAGGCVRDMLLGRVANDFDVATSAEPEDVINLFRRTLKVGAKFGVVIVIMENEQVEVATFRTEAGYTDGRHPAAVKFTSDAEDAARRDFTINGLFYDPLTRKVIDYVNGQDDLKKKLIRTIGKAEERFGEDYLRMLRAVRFSTELGFTIEPLTWSAIRSGAKNITKISGERIATELEGILINPNRSKGASLLFKGGLAAAIFPGFNEEQTEFAVKVLGRLRKRTDFALGLAGLFSGCNSEFATEKLEVLKLSKKLNKHVEFLLERMGELLAEQMPLSRLKMLLAEPYFRDLYELERAIQKTITGGKGISALSKLRRRIKMLGNVELKPRPLLNGYDLIRLGAVQGPALGQLAEEMYIAQLEGDIATIEQAEHWVRKWLQRHRVAES